VKLIEPLSWDTEFFGLPVGRVREGVNTQTLASAVEQADAAQLDCLYLLAAAEDAELIDLAQRHGFRVRDVRLELERSVFRERPVSPRVEATAGVRRASPSDLLRLEPIARERLRGTRFFADPGFPLARCSELYGAWLRRGLQGAPERVTLMLEDASGFLVCRLDPDAGSGAIELVAVSEEASGRGVGARLLSAVEALLSEASLERATVVTQACNIAAQRLYQRHGYRTCGAHTWLHRWRQEPSPRVLVRGGTGGGAGRAHGPRAGEGETHAAGAISGWPMPNSAPVR
jgi:ribosomal protein S18 acetylase RimI-like enzyme